MPPIGLLLNGVNFTDIKLVLKGAGLDEAGKITPPVTLNFGNFIQVLIEFIIVAFAIFMVVKFLNRMHKNAEAELEVPATTNEEQLLTEIRDLLKK